MLDVPRLLARPEGSKFYFDTNVFIYVLNATPEFAAPSLMLLLEACAAGRIAGLTGDVTLAELLVKSLQANEAAAAGAVKELLVEEGAVTLLSHDRGAFEPATQHRARHGLKMVDALPLATAQLAGARCLISNDRQFPPLPGIECLSLAG